MNSVEIILFFVGLLLLVKGSGMFIRSAASIAERMGISEFVIGLTLVALGTSLPELVAAIFASLKKESGLIMGNIVGANIANISLIAGIASLITILKTKKEMVVRDGYIVIFSAALLLVFIIDGVISRIEGGFFLLLYLAYIVFLLETRPEMRGKYHFKEFILYFFRFQYIITIRNKIFSNNTSNKISKKKAKRKLEFGILKNVLIMVVSGLAIYLGAKFIVEGAISLATFWEVPLTVVGIIMAIGTTMPELSVAIAAASKGFGNIILGNSLGSCITNTFLILGIAAMISPLQVIGLTIGFTVPVFILMGMLLILFLRSGWVISKKEGLIFLFLYFLFLITLFLV
ncbi:MAG: calcium/sodium antiporter [Candidatus Woesearchaeota archaeon]